jgi:hypothetical protein
MNATMMFVSQQLQRVASQAAGAAQRVRGARTLREVRDWGHVVVPGYLKAEARRLPEFRRLESAQEQRAGELVGADLAKLDALAGGDSPATDRLAAVKQAYGTLVQRDWVFLRGEQPALLSRATRHAERVIGRLHNETKNPA